MTTTALFDSQSNTSTPLTAVWQIALGSAAENLLDFLQALNDEFDTQTERNIAPHWSERL